MTVVGHSVDGRAIRAHEYGDPGAKRVMLVVGVIHGNERAGLKVVRSFVDRYGSRLHDVDVWVVRTVNPDGLAADTRGNAHGVDLNRNWAHNWKPIPSSSGYYSGPGPFSEPETRAMRGFLR